MSEDNHSTLYEDYIHIDECFQKLQQPHSFSNNDERNLFMKEILTKLQKLDSRIDDSQMFSTNDLYDDISTPHLKYLLVSFTLGDYLLSMPSTIDSRHIYVHAAQIALKKFLDRMDFLLLLNENHKADLEGTSTLDPTALRHKKITEFRREKELRQKLTLLSESRQKLIDEAKKKGIPLDDDNDLIESERDVMFLNLEASIDKSIHHINFIKQEQDLLKHHKKQLDLQKAQAFKSNLTPEEIEKQKKLYDNLPPSEKSAFIGSNTTNPDDSQPDFTPSKPFLVHNVTDTKEPIPSHMKDYMQYVKPPAAKTEQQQQQGHQHSSTCSHGPHPHSHSHGNTECDADRLRKPWFSAQAHDTCNHGDDDVTTRSTYAEYMITKKRGGRGKLVPACPIHGNAHPAGECPGIKDNNLVGGFNRSLNHISSIVDMRNDRHAVFKDSNPYLMDLDDWALMKQREGGLPSERDQILQKKMEADYERQLQRIEDGDSDDEYQALTRLQEEEEEDAAQMKARAWADYTDDHEKGAGNKNYRR